MRDASKTKKDKRKARQKRVRARVSGTAKRPRLSIFRSLSHIYVQLIDDSKGVTLAAASDKEAKAGKKTKSARAAEVGKAIAQKAKAAGISEVVFDRGGNKYHGRVKALAEAAREGGLRF